jgi:hypothetical protein
MAGFPDKLSELFEKKTLSTPEIIREITRIAIDYGYTIADQDDTRPWGGFVRFGAEGGDTFVEKYFPSINPTEARLGNPEASLSPKILYVGKNQRLSWQRHSRRAERWHFLTDGYYYRSADPNNPGEAILALADTEVQFDANECHRLASHPEHPTYVAEIWQHTDPEDLSDEDDIERLQDDYHR